MKIIIWSARTVLLAAVLFIFPGNLAKAEVSSDIFTDPSKILENLGVDLSTQDINDILNPSQSQSFTVQTLNLPTYYLRDDATGGDCATFATWNSSTKTCTLNDGISAEVRIEGHGITFDGNNKTISGTGATSDCGSANRAISSDGYNNLIVKNFTINNFTCAIIVQNTIGSSILNNISNGNGIGIHVGIFNSGYIENNAVRDNLYGITIAGGSLVEIENNIAERSGWWGIAVLAASSSLIQNNNISATTAYGLYSANNTSVTFNNNTVSGSVNFGGLFITTADTLTNNSFNNNQYNFLYFDPTENSVIS